MAHAARTFSTTDAILFTQLGEDLSRQPSPAFRDVLQSLPQPLF
jgi:hypothetical protein